MNEIDVGQIKVPYRIKWSDKRETVGLSLSPEKELTVRAPRTASLEEVDSILEEKKEWILEKFTGFDQQDRPPKEKEFLSGEKLLYNGRRYLLKAVKKEKGNPELSFKLGRFFLYMPEYQDEEKRRESARSTIISWYKKKADEKLPKRTSKYANELEIQTEGVEVKDIIKKWGTYDSKKIILNWRLILASQRIQDYVIVHELAHLKHSEHSKIFWNTVGTILPDYEDRREWLRIHGNSLQI